jgi:hypothetical protein
LSPADGDAPDLDEAPTGPPPGPGGPVPGPRPTPTRATPPHGPAHRRRGATLTELTEHLQERGEDPLDHRTTGPLPRAGTAAPVGPPREQGPRRREPRRVGPGVALLRHPFLFLAVFGLVCGAALAGAAQRQTTHTAEARMLVGSLDVATQAVPGYSAAIENLTAVYARLVETDAVIGPAAEAVGADPDALRANLSASPIPDSAIIRVEADADDEPTAVAWAEASAQALEDYIASVTATDPTASPEYEQYQAASARYAEAQVTEEQLADDLAAISVPDSEDALALGEGLAPAQQDLQTRLAQARSDTLSARFDVDVASDAYRDLLAAQDDVVTVELVASAASTGDDRRSTLAVGAVIGVAGGVLAALGAVTAVSNLGYVRALRRAATVRG